MFGRAFFGGRYFGSSYWGEGEDAIGGVIASRMVRAGRRRTLVMAPARTVVRSRAAP
jgi:hypothetical protein